MNICVVGLGYVGVPMACVLAQAGHRVTGVDIRRDIVDNLNQCRLHITEPMVRELLSTAVAQKNFFALTQPVQSEVFMICVPTPVRGGDNQPDLSFVDAAARSLLPVLKAGDLVVIESTIPVGATAQVAAMLRSERPDLTDSVLHVAYCPERVLPGNAIHEIIHNHRIVGGTTAKATQLAAGLYRSFIQGKLIETSAAMAELAKLAENTYRDVNIAFANELSRFCRECDLDPYELIRLANMHPRVNIHAPGIGVGGHCIPVDPWFLVNSFSRQAILTRTARQVNLLQEDWVVQQVLDASRRHQPAQVVLVGLTYKPDVDDFRESPALRIADQLSRRLTPPLIGVDPHAAKLRRERQVGFALRADIPLKSNSLIVILVPHCEFDLALPQIEALPDVVVINFTGRGGIGSTEDA